MKKTDPIQRLEHKILFYKILLGITVVGMILSQVIDRHPPFAPNSDEKPNIISSAENIPSDDIPHFKTVMAIVQPLRYSGLPMFLREDVRLTIDSNKQTWKISNLHRFNSKGNVVLEDNRYGLCGELAGYVYQNIKTLFDNKYSITFLRVSESGYFLSPQSSHIVLLIRDKENPKNNTFILDPSFHRYGHIEDFDEYNFFGSSPSLDFITQKDPDGSFDIEHGMPILIHNDFLLSLMVEKAGDKFDINNFTIALAATQRYKFSGRYLFAIRKKDGKEEIYENKFLTEEILNSEEYAHLREKIVFLFKNASL